MEGLRQKDVFDLSQVHTVIAETNGSLSVLLKAPAQPVSADTLKKDVSEPGMPQLLVADGCIRPEGLTAANLDRAQLERLLAKEQVALRDVFLLTVDRTGKTVLVRREAVK